MKVSEYRREYAKFCEAREREIFRSQIGTARDPRADSPFLIFADLFSLETISDLKIESKNAAMQFESEREGHRVLLAAAQLVHADIASREARRELERCEGAAQFTWNGAATPARTIGMNLIANEAAPASRREIALRVFDALKSCDDSHVERAKTLQTTARSLGFDNYLAIRSNASRAQADALSMMANEFLKRTSEVYRAHLSQWAASDIPFARLDELTYADSLFFKRAKHMDAHFRGLDLHAVYEAAIRAFGIRTDQQPNVHIDTVLESSGEERSICFGIKPPEEVRLVGAISRQASDVQNFIGCAGRAQAYAWTSTELVARHPEFVYTPDRATNYAYYFLFRSLLQDEQWIGEHFVFASTTNSTAARAFALLDSHDARRSAARAVALTAAPNDDLSSEGDAEEYAQLMTEATNFRYDASVHLIDWSARVDSIDELRARLFAAHLREHLRTRHGHRWWTVRSARDELIDLWNTGSRYSVEELAALLTGATALDVECLVQANLEALNDQI